MSFHNKKKLRKLSKKKAWLVDPSKCLTDSQVKLVFHAVNRRKPSKKRSALIEYIVVTFLFLTGVRRSELTNLKWKHIILDSNEPHIFIEQGKSQRSRRIIPLHPHLVTSIFYYIKRLKALGELKDLPNPQDFFLKNPSGNKYSGYGLYLIFARVISEINLPHKNPHIARHTFAVDLYKRSNFNLRLVQNVLGHSSVRVTEVYTHVSLHDVKIACNQLYEENF